jgi:hypothetical protein
MNLTNEQYDSILKKYGCMLPALEHDYVENVPYCGNRIYIIYKLDDGYAIYKLYAPKVYKLEEILGNITENEMEYLNGLDHDKWHRRLIAREYKTNTPVLPYDKI